MRVQISGGIAPILTAGLLAFVCPNIAAAQQAAPVSSADTARPDLTLEGLKALVTSAEAAGDAPTRRGFYARALDFYDTLSVQQPVPAEAFDAPAFLIAAAEAFLAYAAGVAGAEQHAALGQAGDVMPRIRDERTAGALYVRMAEIHLAAGDTDAATLDLRRADGAAARVSDTAAADQLRLSMIRLSLRLEAIDVDTKLAWASQLGASSGAPDAFRAIAMAEIAAKRASKALLKAAGTRGVEERRAALTALIAVALGEGKFTRALYAALAIDDAEMRDDLLVELFAAETAARVKPESVYAPFAISPGARRDRALAAYAAFAVDRGRLAIARFAIQRVPDGPDRQAAMARIADRLLRESFSAEWAPAWDESRRLMASITDLTQRITAGAELARQALAAGDVTRAGAMADDVDALAQGDAAALNIRRDMALAEIAAGRPEAAAAALNTLTPDGRSAVAAQLYAVYRGRGNAEAAAGVAGMIARPLDKAYRRIADWRADPAGAAAALGEAAALAGEAEPGLERDGLIGELAAAFAARGEDAAIAALMPLAGAESAPQLDAYRLGAMARRGAADAAETALAALDPKRQDLSHFEISAAFLAGEDWMRAFDAAKAIGGDGLRRRALRRVAEAQARVQRRRDPEPDRMDAPPPDSAAALLSGGIMARTVHPDPPENLRGLFENAEVTAADVRRIVPQVDPGAARLVPTGFSNFDEKFSYIRYLNSVDLNGGEEQIFAEGQGTLFPSFILIESGTFDLPTLQRMLDAELEPGDARPITNKGRIYQLNLPLLIGRDATLIVSSADVEELRLSTPGHAYLINSGQFFLVGATLTSWDEAKEAPTARTKDDWSVFNPFYTAWSGSKTYIADAHVSAMGYANGKSYGLSISSGPVNVLKATLNSIAPPTGIIVDSTFSKMYYAFYSYEAMDVAIVGNEYRDNEIYGVDPHDRSERLTIAYNAAYGTRVKHGIIVSREVKHSAMIGNISADNHGSGFMLDRSSDDNVVAYNIGFRNGADGLTIYESSCNIVARNTMVQNRRDGIKLRNSWDQLIHKNVIADNHGFGLNLYAMKLEGLAETAERDFELDPYERYADASVLKNEIARNGKSPIRTRDASAVVLAGNRVSGALNKLMQQLGFGPATGAILSRAAEGVMVRDTCKPARPRRACAFMTDGRLGHDYVGDMEALGSECRTASN